MSNPDTTRQLPIPAPHMLDMDSKPHSPYRVIRPEDTESLRTTRSPSAGQLDPMITATGLVKSYRKHKTEVPVLKGVDFVAPKGRVTAIIGQSGSGKAPCCICSELSTNPMQAKSPSMAKGSIA